MSGDEFDGVALHQIHYFKIDHAIPMRLAAAYGLKSRMGIAHAKFKS